MYSQTTTTDIEALDANKRIARRFLELISEHRIEELCALVAPTWTMYGGPPNLPSGPDGIRALFGTFTKIEQLWTLEDVIAEGDRVVVRASNVVVQDSFFGIDARGVRQQFSAMFMFRIADGLVLEVHRNADDLGRLLQLGARLMPADWRHGDDVVIAPAVSDDDARQRFPMGFQAVKPYLRITPQPNL